MQLSLLSVKVDLWKRRQGGNVVANSLFCHTRTSVAIAGTGSFKAAPEGIKLAWTTQHASLCACIPFENNLYYLQYISLQILFIVYYFIAVFGSRLYEQSRSLPSAQQQLAPWNARKNIHHQSLPAGSGRSSPIVTTSRGIPGTITTLSSLYRNPRVMWAPGTLLQVENYQLCTGNALEMQKKRLQIGEVVRHMHTDSMMYEDGLAL